MPAISHPRRPPRAHGPRGRRLWCGECDTDQRLVIETIQAPAPPRTGLILAAYTCVGCGFFYSHLATVEQVAAVLNGPGQGYGVFQFGGTYFHCGEPMPATGIEHRTISDTAATVGPLGGPVEVCLRTRVMRCRCGFRMEIPE